MLELCEILDRQLDVTCRTILDGAPDISVYKQRTIRQRRSDTVRNGHSRAAWDGHDPGP
jgi:hypothetical protein